MYWINTFGSNIVFFWLHMKHLICLQEAIKIAQCDETCLLHLWLSTEKLQKGIPLGSVNTQVNRNPVNENREQNLFIFAGLFCLFVCFLQK